ncbi:VWA containing CoxE family protein, partial [Streptomyces sp. 2MCAF27]
MTDITHDTSGGGADENRRQVLYWRLLARLFDPEEQPALEAASVTVVDDLGLPPALLDPAVSVDSLVQRFPDLETEFQDLMVPSDKSEGDEEDGTAPEDSGEQVRRAALVSKLLLNVFNTGAGDVTAKQLADWQRDAGWCKQALGAEGAEELSGTLSALEGEL